MKRIVLSLVIITIVFNACKKSEQYDTLSIHDYYPLKVGKYITYNLDSTVYTNFGTVEVIVNYQVKYEVDALITDNLGRPAYRIIRYIRKITTDPWVADNTFMAVPTDFSIEFIENNLRFLKMKSPLKNGFTWKGNSYIDTYSINSKLRYLDGWDYSYDSLNLKSVVNGVIIDSTIKINQRDEIIGYPSDPLYYSEINQSVEKYAKGIGLIYKNFLHVEYQPAVPAKPAYKEGYGITLTMTDHN